MRRRLFLVATLLAAATPALARLGGGEGYSGGGGSGGGGGGGGGAAVEAIVRLLLWLVFRHPVIGIPLVVAAIVIYARLKRAGALDFVSSTPTVLRSSGSAALAPERVASLDRLRAADRNFSEPVFLDFAQLVYVRAQSARPSGETSRLVPWVSEEATAPLFVRREGLEEVRDVVLGSIRITGLAEEAGFDLLDVDFEANVTEVRAGHPRQLLVRDRYTFRRRSGVLSPTPDRMRSLSCAGCGSTLEPAPDGACPNCGAPRTGGRLQWEVARIAPLDRRTVTPPDLRVGGGIEPGTNAPTRVDPGLADGRREMERRRPGFSWPDFDARVRSTFLRLQGAWGSLRWEEARPFETDALFQSHRFWIERYRAFGLRNRMEDIEILDVQVCRVGFDAFHEFVAVRIFARMLDWTLDAEGRVVGGSPDEPRTFSEYWTFLRSSEAPSAVSREAATCPSCAAPLDRVNAAGICEYCGSKIVTGAFDWVVSRIEQD